MTRDLLKDAQPTELPRRRWPRFLPPALLAQDDQHPFSGVSSSGMRPSVSPAPAPESDLTVDRMDTVSASASVAFPGFGFFQARADEPLETLISEKGSLVQANKRQVHFFFYKVLQLNVDVRS